VFVGERARPIANFLARGLEPYTDERSKIFDLLIQQEPNRSDLLESYLQGPTADIPLFTPTVQVMDVIDFKTKSMSQNSDSESMEVDRKVESSVAERQITKAQKTMHALIQLSNMLESL
jgi:hypothetical protein